MQQLPKQKTRGFTLVELMIALVLGLLVLAAVIQLFLGSKTTYMTNEALARVQENGRFALELIKPELRSANIRGLCAGRASVTNHLNDDCTEASVQTLFDTSHSIVGWEYSGTGRGADFTIPTDLSPGGLARSSWTSQASDGSSVNLPAALAGRVVPGTDVLVTRNLNLLDMDVTGVQNDTQLAIGGGSDTIPPESVVLVSNCESGADLFQQSSRENDSAAPTKPTMSCSTGSPGNNPPGQSGWGTQHDGTSSVFTITTVAYYIGWNAARGEPGLYRAELSNRDVDEVVHEELVEGVENLQLTYWGTDSGQTATAPYTADEVADWSLIVGVTMGLLVRSPENADNEEVSQEYDLAFLNATTPTDRRLRHAFSSTVAVRNQQIIL